MAVEDDDLAHPIDIYSLIPDEDSLHNLTEAFTKVETEFSKVETEIVNKKDAILRLKESETDTLEFIEDTCENQLQRAENVLGQIESLDGSVLEAVSEISRLDRMKRNLEAVMSVMKKIQMVQNGMDQIESLLAKHKYSEIAPLLLAILQLAERLALIVGQTRNLRKCLDRLDEMHHVLWNSIISQFKAAAAVKGGFRPNRQHVIMLAQACLVVEVLGPSFRKKLVDWYVEGQLKDYKDLFRGNLEMATLGRLNNRFHWLQRLLQRFHAEHEIIFMPSWAVAQTVCAHFCAVTAKDIADALRLCEGRNDPEILMTSIREAQGFERGLAQMFPEAEPSLFAITPAFEGHMGILVQIQQKEFSSFINALPVKLEAADFESGHLLASSPRFFLLIRDALQDTVALGSKSLIKDLLILLNNNLSSYARYLQDRLPKRLDMGKLLKQADIKLVCALLSTAQYCIDTSQQLDEQLRTSCLDVMQDGNNVVGLGASIQTFHVLASRCLTQIDLHAMLALKPHWASMSSILKSAWHTQHQVGDQSPYIQQIGIFFDTFVQTIKRFLVRPQLLEKISSRIAHLILDTFRQTMYDCKPISISGGQQLIVDISGLNQFLAESCKFGLEEEIAKETALIEGLVKTILLPPEPADTFVEGYLLLVADPSITAFDRVIQLKSLTKAEHAGLTESFQRLVPEAPSGPLRTTPGNKLLAKTSRPAAPSTTDQVINRLKNIDLRATMDFEEHVKKISSIAAGLRRENVRSLP